MTVSEYVKKWQELVEKNPEIQEYKVVASSDDEGNSFNPVYYDPTIGYFQARKFIPVEGFEEYDEDCDEILKANAVCIN